MLAEAASGAPEVILLATGLRAADTTTTTDDVVAAARRSFAKTS